MTDNKQEVLKHVQEISQSPGFLHVLAMICFNDAVSFHSEEVKADEFNHLYDERGLIRTEIATLQGFMVQGDNEVSRQMLSDEDFRDLMQQTYEAMQHLHESMVQLPFEVDDNGNVKAPAITSEHLKEAIYYGAESAYVHQYHELSKAKYEKDADWLMENKGLNPEWNHQFFETLMELMPLKAQGALRDFDSLRTVLPAFEFSIDEVSERSGIGTNDVERIVDEFCLRDPGNYEYSQVTDFNLVNAKPLLPGDSADHFVLLLPIALAESMFDSPFYWMAQDANYVDSAFNHRGQFTEEFCSRRLASVFGVKSTHQGVDLYSGKRVAGEVDFLCVYSDRLILGQAKSKKLRLISRSGEIEKLQQDFQAAVQDAYDQAVSCAELLLTGECSCKTKNGKVVNLPKSIEKIYIVCAVSDHYPSLTFQSRQFLRTVESPKLSAPFVCDVFTLDLMAEFLTRPLYFLSYLDRRTSYNDRVLANHEVPVLAFHLSNNLWLQDDTDLMYIGDDFCTNLDAALLKRVSGIDERALPEGILTKMRETELEKILVKIGNNPDPGSTLFGLFLLTLSEDSLLTFNDSINSICDKDIKEGGGSDFAMYFDESKTGVTVHANRSGRKKTLQRLLGHCKLKKYQVKATTWMGIAIDSRTKKVKLGVAIREPWKFDPVLDKLQAELKPV